MLLIDDDESDVLELGGTFDQGMRADDEGGGERRAFLLGAGADGNAESERFEPAIEIGPQLFCEDFSGCHEEDRMATLDCHEGSAGGHDGFSGSDIPLEQSSHGDRGSKVRADLAQDVGLRVSETEGELGEERTNEMIIASAGQGFGIGFERFSTSLDAPLQMDEFVESQSSSRQVGIVGNFGEMQIANGLGTGRPANGGCGGREVEFGDGCVRGIGRGGIAQGHDGGLWFREVVGV